MVRLTGKWMARCRWMVVGMVVMKRNGWVVPRTHMEQDTIREGDAIEVVRLVRGG